jgi:hypothetical protein
MTACPSEYDAVRKVSPPELAPIIEKPDQPVEDGEAPEDGEKGEV